jgi:hypothetical protein
MFVMACDGVVGAVSPMFVVNRRAFEDRRATRVRVPRVHVYRFSRSAGRIGGAAMSVECMSTVRRWFDVIVVPGTLRVMWMRVMIS